MPSRSSSRTGRERCPGCRTDRSRSSPARPRSEVFASLPTSACAQHVEDARRRRDRRASCTRPSSRSRTPVFGEMAREHIFYVATLALYDGFLDRALGRFEAEPYAIRGSSPRARREPAGVSHLAVFGRRGAGHHWGSCKRTCVTPRQPACLWHSEVTSTIRSVFLGYSAHEELELMVEAGLTPAQALAAATVGGASFLQQESSLGKLAPGYHADLLILDENPLQAIANTRLIHAVIRDGRRVKAVVAAAVAKKAEASSSSASAPERLVPQTDPGKRVLEFDLPGLEIGIAEYEEGPTGTTVFYFPAGAQVVADVRGGSVATINTDLLRPGHGDGHIEAIVLSRRIGLWPRSRGRCRIGHAGKPVAPIRGLTATSPRSRVRSSMTSAVASPRSIPMSPSAAPPLANARPGRFSTRLARSGPQRLAGGLLSRVDPEWAGRLFSTDRKNKDRGVHGSQRLGRSPSTGPARWQGVATAISIRSQSTSPISSRSPFKTTPPAGCGEKPGTAALTANTTLTVVVVNRRPRSPWAPAIGD